MVTILKFISKIEDAEICSCYILFRMRKVEYKVWEIWNKQFIWLKTQEIRNWRTKHLKGKHRKVIQDSYWKFQKYSQQLGQARSWVDCEVQRKVKVSRKLFKKIYSKIFIIFCIHLPTKLGSNPAKLIIIILTTNKR